MSIQWSCYCIFQVYVIIHVCDSVRSFWFEAHVFIVCLHLYCHWIPNYQEREVGVPLTGKTLPHCFACPRLIPGFPIFVFNGLRWEGVVVFVDIGGIDHHCKNLFFKTLNIETIQHNKETDLYNSVKPNPIVDHFIHNCKMYYILQK